MEKILTVVVPTYNMEQYLDRCLTSLIVDDEKMALLEVLVVNDGSKDRSSEIAHNYEARYPDTFRVIDKENGNYGSCMNVGLAMARGKYFKTLDADDWYDTGAFDEFLESLTLADEDMVITSRFDYYESSGHSEYISIRNFLPNVDRVSDLDSISQGSAPNDFLCVQNICYKTSVLVESNMYWPEKVFYTDAIYDYWPLRAVNSIQVLDKGVYVYFMGRGDQSMSMRSVRKNGKSLFVVANEILRDYVDLALKWHTKTIDSYIFCCIKYIYDRLLLICGKTCDDYIRALDDIMYNSNLYQNLERTCVQDRMSYLKSFRYSHLKIRLLFCRMRVRLALKMKDS